MSEATTTAVRIEVEVLGLTIREGGLHYRRRCAVTGGLRSPDEVAAELGEVTAGRGVVCHSTSWRWRPPAPGAGPAMVLTYAVVPDLTAGDGDVQPVLDAGIVCSTQPEQPSPANLHEHHVVAHAVRHLADLARRDPTIAGAARRHREVWDAILDVASGLTVAPHPDLPPHVPSHAVNLANTSCPAVLSASS